MNNNNISIKKKHKLLVSFMALALIAISAIIGVSNQSSVSALTSSNSGLGNSGFLLAEYDKENLPNNARREYESWKQNILSTIGKKNSEQPHIYISAKVQRLDTRTGEIKIALAQQSARFRLEIQPIETEKTADGNMFIKQVGEKATVDTTASNGSLAKSKVYYSEPSITFIAEDKANAVELILYPSTTKAMIKLVLPFTVEPSNGVLTSVGN